MEQDIGLRAQIAAEERLEYYLEEEGSCGCITCMVREVLTAAWPVFEQAPPNLRSLK